MLTIQQRKEYLKYVKRCSKIGVPAQSIESWLDIKNEYKKAN